MKSIRILLKRSFFNDQLNNVGKVVDKTFPKYSNDEFDLISRYRIGTIKRAFENLKEVDSTIKDITFTDLNNALTVEIENQGEFKIFVDNKDSLLYMFSPLSGSFVYYYDKDEEKFYNTRDEHNMEEMLTREVLKLCKSYLDL